MWIVVGYFFYLYFFNYNFLHVSRFYVTFATKKKRRSSMTDFNITSFTELLQCGEYHTNTSQQNPRYAHESRAMNKGVYIQDIKGKLWKTEDWDGSMIPNAIAVIADEVKFLIALKQTSSVIQINRSCDCPLENYMTGIQFLDTAMADYDGAGNTAKTMQMQPSTNYAAGYCDAFIFPDGKTKGYLPSFGQLYLAHRNKVDIAAALSACGGTEMKASYYWSSTFHGIYSSACRRCWGLKWGARHVGAYDLNDIFYARPFADFK